MLKNYIKIATRNLIRRKSYSILNVVGLSTGLACVIFIANWVIDETSYDTHFSNADNIYRIVEEVGVDTDRWHQAVTSLPLGTTLQSSYPEVEAMTRIDYNDAMVSYGDTRYIEDDILMVDPEFFGMFDQILLKGNANTALSNPYKIVLTESIAKKYFGNEDPIGQFLKLYVYDSGGDGADYEVTGVVKDPEPNSHFTYNVLGSISTLEASSAGQMEDWGSEGYYTYIQLREGTSITDLEAKFPQMIQSNLEEAITEYNMSFRFYGQSITSIHLNSDLMYEMGVNSSSEYVWIFSAIGIFILLLAVINYVNLSTSIALERSKEVGVRKIMGALKSHLIRQHLVETFVLTLASIIIAGLLIELFKGTFYELTGKSHITFDWVVLSVQLLGISIPIGLVAGYLPAFFLARLETLNALKGTIDKNSKSGLRSTLVTIQFSATIIVLVGLVVVQQQLKYVQTQDLGYNRHNLLTIRSNGDENVVQGIDAFKNTLLASSNITHVTTAGSIISSGLSNGFVEVLDDKGEQRTEKIHRLRVDHNYISTYGMELLTGRDFSESIKSDSTREFIINERSAEVFGWTPEQAVGKEFQFFGRSGSIIGVVKNFHFNSFHHTILPMCLYKRQNFSRIIIRGNDAKELLATVSGVWKKHFPPAIFDHQFQDQALADTYENDARFGTIFNVFSGVSMLIAFLGLFGLVGYTVTKRAKEIGIRKVLGASSNQILYMLSIKFVHILLVAAVIGAPFAWYIMDNWLAGFSYHIDMQMWHFALAIAMLLLVAVAIIFVQSMRSIMANPAITLKEE